jgi:hypothetical protein
MMNGQMLLDWCPEHAAAMDREIFQAHHRLHENPLFSDENLIRIFDAHDPASLLIYTSGTNKERREDDRLGRRGNVSAAELLQAVREGRLWLNILRMQRFHPEFRILIDALYDELEAHCPGFRALRRSANLLVSSPTAMVYYHADAPLNMLWHLRGRKRIWVYPPHDERFAPQEDVERIFSGEESEDLEYRPEFDSFAKVFDLEPGQMVTWPQNTPHRIENLEGLNVSLSTEHYTHASFRRRDMFLANHYLRRWLHLPMRSFRSTGPVALAKRLAYRSLSRLGFRQAQHYELSAVTFEVDPQAPLGLRNVPSSPRGRGNY